MTLPTTPTPAETPRWLGVLSITPYLAPNVGGQETHVSQLTEGLLREGVPVRIIAYRPLTSLNIPYQRHEKSGLLEVWRLPWPHGEWVFWVMNRTVWLYFLYLTPGLFVASFLFLLLRGREVSVIHAHGLVGALIARILGPLFGKRTLMSIHSVYQFEQRPELAAKVGLILRGLDGVFPLAPASERDLLATGVAPERFYPSTQWLDLDHFSPQATPLAEVMALAPPNHLRLLTVGRLYEGKGVQVLAEAVANSPHPVCLFVVGSGPVEEQLQVLARRCGRIFLLGGKNQQELPGVYAAVDMVAQPSLVEEGFSRVVMEALACGKPVLASNRGCLPQMIRHGETGFLVPPTTEDLSAWLDSHFTETPDLAQLGQAARAHAEQHFHPRNISSILGAYFPQTAAHGS